MNTFGFCTVEVDFSPHNEWVMNASESTYSHSGAWVWKPRLTWAGAASSPRSLWAPPFSISYKGQQTLTEPNSSFLLSSLFWFLLPLNSSPWFTGRLQRTGPRLESMRHRGSLEDEGLPSRSGTKMGLQRPLRILPNVPL